jgi:hypothetical protein
MKLMMKHLFPILLASCLIGFGCDTWKSSPLDETHTITITNLSQCSILVILDGQDTIELTESGSSGQFIDVDEGWHECIAYRDEGDFAPVIIEKLILFISERKDYYWTLNRCGPE